MATKLKTSTIRQRVTIPAPPAQVYAALTQSRLHAAFTGAAASGPARVGYRFDAWDGYINGRHLRLEVPRRIVQEWHTTKWPRDYPPSQLDLRLEKHGANTRITMVQSGVPAHQAARYRRGWREFYWEPLKAYFRR